MDTPGNIQSQQNQMLRIQVHYETEQEHNFNIQMQRNATVHQLKEKIQNQANIAIHRQKLIYGGQILDNDSSPLTAYGIENNSAIQLIITNNQTTESSTFFYDVERSRMTRGVRDINSLTLSSLGWYQFVGFEGARVPEPPDTLDYPQGACLEFLRQGLLTYNTYVSVLSIPEAYRPHRIEIPCLQVTSSHGVEGRREFHVGQWVDALDTVNKWLEATVIAVRDEFVFIHYNGWGSNWDEWLHVNSSRLAPFRTRTRFVALRSTLSPDVVSWSGGVSPTGRDDVNGIIRAISDATRNIWECLDRASRDLSEDMDSLHCVYCELSPLLDRAGRLSADASRLLHFVGVGGRMNESVESIPSAVQLPPIPTLVTTQNPREGMNGLVNSMLSDGDELIPSTHFADNHIRVETVDPYDERTQNPQQILNLRQMVNPQSSNNASQNNPHATPLNMLQELMQQLFTLDGVNQSESVSNNNNPSNENHPSPPILSSSVTRPQSSGPSLLERLEKAGLVSRDNSNSHNSMNGSK